MEHGDTVSYLHEYSAWKILKEQKKKLVHQCVVFDSSLFKISESASFYELVLLEHSSNKELRVVKV